MKILFYGDSITDACRDTQANIGDLTSYGFGYVMQIAGRLLKENPEKYHLVYIVFYLLLRKNERL